MSKDRIQFTSASSENLQAPEALSEDEICRLILNARAVDIRDVDRGEEPFSYSSGNWGPGYIMIKGLVGEQHTFKTLVEQLAVRVVDSEIDFDFIAANATGGMVPGYQLREDLQRITGRDIPYTYVRGTRKKIGQKELMTGAPYIASGSKALVVEELVNFAQTTTNSALGVREQGHVVENAATILHYQNPEALKRLEDNNISVVQLTSLPKLLEVAESGGYFSSETVRGYREFLQDPLAWQGERGLEPLAV
jgi:orotate phosphoribosyltransferase